MKFYRGSPEYTDCQDFRKNIKPHFFCIISSGTSLFFVNIFLLLNKISCLSNRNSDRPNRNFGKDEGIFDIPNRNFGKDNRMSGRPNRNFDRPDCNSDRPNRNSGKDNRMFGRPNCNSDRPELNSGKDNRNSDWNNLNSHCNNL